MKTTEIDGPADGRVNLYTEQQRAELTERLDRALYHVFKQMFESKPAASGDIFYGNEQVTPNNAKFDLEAYGKEVSAMFWRNMNDRVYPNDYQEIIDRDELIVGVKVKNK